MRGNRIGRRHTHEWHPEREDQALGNAETHPQAENEPGPIRHGNAIQLTE